MQTAENTAIRDNIAKMDQEMSNTYRILRCNPIVKEPGLVDVNIQQPTGLWHNSKQPIKIVWRKLRPKWCNNP